MDDAQTPRVDLGIPGLSPALWIGSGGSATVYSATDDEQTSVAVKILRLSTHRDEGQKAFAKELKILERLSGHSGIVPVLVSGTTDRGEPFLTMPLMKGSVQDALDLDGAMRWRDAASIMIEVAESIQFAHDSSVLHRDIKPANLLLDANGRPLVADFGIGKLTDGDLSVSSHIAATPSFAAPERYTGQPATVACDVYSMGATLAALLSGSAPFRTGERDTPEAIMKRVLEDPPPNLVASHDVPDALAEVVERAMAKDPTTRHASANDFASALASALSGAGVRPVAEPTVRLPRDEAPTRRMTAPAALPVDAARMMRPTEVATPTRQQRRWPLVVFGAVAAAMVAVMAIWDPLDLLDKTEQADSAVIVPEPISTESVDQPESAADPTAVATEPEIVASRLGIGPLVWGDGFDESIQTLSELFGEEAIRNDYRELGYLDGLLHTGPLIAYWPTADFSIQSDPTGELIDFWSAPLDGVVALPWLDELPRPLAIGAVVNMGDRIDQSIENFTLDDGRVGVSSCWIESGLCTLVGRAEGAGLGDATVSEAEEILFLYSESSMASESSLREELQEPASYEFARQVKLGFSRDWATDMLGVAEQTESFDDGLTVDRYIEDTTGVVVIFKDDTIDAWGIVTCADSPDLTLLGLNVGFTPMSAVPPPSFVDYSAIPQGTGLFRTYFAHWWGGPSRATQHRFQLAGANWRCNGSGDRNFCGEASRLLQAFPEGGAFSGRAEDTPPAVELDACALNMVGEVSAPIVGTASGVEAAEESLGASSAFILLNRLDFAPALMLAQSATVAPTSSTAVQESQEVTSLEPFRLAGSSVDGIPMSPELPHLVVDAATAAFGQEPVDVDTDFSDRFLRSNFGTWTGDGFSFHISILDGQMSWRIEFADARYGDEWPTTPTGRPLHVAHLLDSRIEYDPAAFFATYPRSVEGEFWTCSFETGTNTCMSIVESGGSFALQSLRSGSVQSRLSFWTSSLNGVNVRDRPTLEPGESEVLGQLDIGDDAVMIGGTYIPELNEFEWCQVLVDLDIAPVGELTVGHVFSELLNNCRFDL